MSDWNNGIPSINPQSDRSSSQGQAPQAPSVSTLRKVFNVVTKFVKGYLIGVGLLFTVMPILLIFMVHKFSSDRSADHLMNAAVEMPGEFNLMLTIDGQVVDDAPMSGSSFFRQFFQPMGDVTLGEAKVTLRKAAQDERVKGLMINLINMDAAPSSMHELRRMIEKFRETSKKPVQIVLSSGGDQEYLFSTVAEQIALTPAGELELSGPVLQMTYFKEALAKLGVEFEVYQSGKYKSAFEPFIMQSPSPSSIEVMTSLEDSLRKSAVELVSKWRNKPVADVEGWFRQSFFTPEESQSRGIIDAIAHPTEVKNLFSALTKTDKYVDWLDYFDSKTEADEPRPSGDGLGIIYAVGEVAMTSGGDPDRTLIPERMREELEWMAENDEVRAVILRIDSPGGSAAASEMIWKDVEILREKKPVIVSMGDVAASGGYYIAAPASKILAEPATITGSIGVIGAAPKLTGVEEKWGVSFHTITQSERRSHFDPVTKTSDEDRALIAKSITYTYDLFKNRVAKGRNMPRERVDQLAEGRVYTGAQALEIGLVDELGGLSDAFQVAKELGGLDKEKLYPVYLYEGDDMNFFSCMRSASDFFKCLDKAKSSLSLLQRPTIPFNNAADEAIQTAQRIANLVQTEGILTYASTPKLVERR
jgi:protease-4